MSEPTPKIDDGDLGMERKMRLYVDAKLLYDIYAPWMHHVKEILAEAFAGPTEPDGNLKSPVRDKPNE